MDLFDAVALGIVYVASLTKWRIGGTPRFVARRARPGVPEGRSGRLVSRSGTPGRARNPRTAHPPHYD